MLKYRVEIQDFGKDYGRRKMVNNVSLTKAWRIVNRAARRGVKLYGGRVAHGNWGEVGGKFAENYRSACIYMTRY